MYNIVLRTRDDLLTWERSATSRELRMAYKLIERDLNYHAGRIYLQGKNQLFRYYGMQIIQFRVVYIMGCILHKFILRCNYNCIYTNSFP